MFTNHHHHHHLRDHLLHRGHQSHHRRLVLQSHHLRLGLQTHPRGDPRDPQSHPQDLRSHPRLQSHLHLRILAHHHDVHPILHPYPFHRHRIQGPDGGGVQGQIHRRPCRTLDEERKSNHPYWRIEVR
ncbi:hypothetical protein N7454_010282 [Penicillium verhagenii]|nr:hypothetical protein N7454_010282 [Penicillium verhagenii]